MVYLVVLQRLMVDHRYPSDVPGERR